MMTQTRFISKLLFLAICGSLVSSCSGQKNDSSHTGYVEAEWVFVSAPEPGWMTKQSIQVGQMVVPGDTLFELDKTSQKEMVSQLQAQVDAAQAMANNLSRGARPAEIRALEAQLAEAQARLSQAESERDRIMPLVNDEIETEAKGDQVQNQYLMAEAALRRIRESIDVAKMAARSGVRRSAEASVNSAIAAKNSAEYRLSQRSVQSLIAGRIAEVFHYPGEFLPLGSAVVAILPSDGLKLKFFVSQEELAELEFGQKVNVFLSGQEESEGQISFISSSPEYTPPVLYSNEERERLVFLIEADLPSSTKLLPGIVVDLTW